MEFNQSGQAAKQQKGDCSVFIHTKGENIAGPFRLKQQSMTRSKV